MDHTYVPSLIALVPIAFVIAALLSGCASSSSGAGWDPQPLETYVLVYLTSGERVQEKSAEERTAIQAAHMENIRRLAEEGSLLVAGPFGRENHDPTVRGLFVFDVRSLDAARALTDTDPAVQEGVLAMRAHRFETDADLRAAVAADFAAEAEARRAGRELPMQDRIRAYGLVRTERYDALATLREDLPAEDRAIITARVDGGRGFCVIHTDDLPRLREHLAASTNAMGPYTLDEWWASASLVQADRAR